MIIDQDRIKKKDEAQKEWDDVATLYFQLVGLLNDRIIERFFDLESTKNLKKKKRVMQELVNGKTPIEIGKDYLDILEKLPEDEDMEITIAGQRICRADFD